MLQTIYFKLMLFFWTFYSLNNTVKNLSQFTLKYLAAQLFSTLIIMIIIQNIIINIIAPNQHINKISKGSRDT